MTEATPLAGQTWQELLARRSFIELDALGRAAALLDPGTLRVLSGPFDRLESPWLEPQGITPQADDGTVIARGAVDGKPVVIAAIEQGFLGGGTGEVSGAKISQALLLAAADSRAGTPTAAVILFETGGVRLQEANLGLNAVAEICSALLDLRPHAPVIGVVAGTVGSFGGMSIAAGLCTRLIVTPQARIGLNGPAVIEQEGGIDEFDSRDHILIWAIDGGEQRHAIGLADDLVPDDADRLRTAVIDAVNAGVPRAGHHRSERLDVLASRLAVLNPADAPTPRDLRTLWGASREPAPAPATAPVAALDPPATRGRTWLAALSGTATVQPVIPSVLSATTADARYLAVVPDPDNRFYRAREGQVGVTESLALAQAVHDIVHGDRHAQHKRAVIAIVDLPSQAYGRYEEMAGLHQAMAAATDAYHRARVAGHPIVAVVVGTALSGGFLTHGLQANQILALDAPGVEIHAMHKEAAAKITLRSVAELDELAKTIVPMSYRVEDWAKLGFCDGLLTVADADNPTPDDVASVAAAVTAAIQRARRGPFDLSNRLESDAAVTGRRASRAVRDLLARQWEGAD
ncbi:biotin-independent malonate decarboxylase subunit beta [Mycolicibacterium confluentis]|uniref:Biotin-independent malonate decarboxylase subunit beta n=1 Tax=Mycolicibacterium confluentis TaxID=28047 RepID=A0A7I7XRN2_9MYCO|nr:biotin-independent malonate decarboxylase subunit beta [Mycolicibacterium confluentis]MCV7318730.1 biotin-independent malonate decarboxylase subunit beta [Mycolicibacterium confluentis]ORV23146.1 biotin-independent malonate decarboxylase subunit beta [Mycolicibacterium confluentis]BBZ31878.1 biotin-independent malonate decarboxylase subunit beta [Mycolicibacterium confluentis]